MTRPSWSDYGTHDESAYPQMWDGCIGAWCPFLGDTGLRQHDLSRSMSWESATSLPSYITRSGVVGISGNPTITGATPAIFLGMTQATLLVWASKSTQTDVVACAALRGGNASRFSLAWFSDGNLYASFESQGSLSFNTVALTGAGLKLIALQYAAPTVGNQRAVWIDGVRTASGTPPSSLATTTTTHGLASDGFNNTSTNGAIHGMMVWNRCLSNNELQTIFSVGMPELFRRPRRPQRQYAPEQATGARRRRILCGDYS